MAAYLSHHQDNLQGPRVHTLQGCMRLLESPCLLPSLPPGSQHQSREVWGYKTGLYSPHFLAQAAASGPTQGLSVGCQTAFQYCSKSASKCLRAHLRKDPDKGVKAKTVLEKLCWEQFHSAKQKLRPHRSKQTTQNELKPDRGLSGNLQNF